MALDKHELKPEGLAFPHTHALAGMTVYTRGEIPKNDIYLHPIQLQRLLLALSPERLITVDPTMATHHRAQVELLEDAKLALLTRIREQDDLIKAMKDRLALCDAVDDAMPVPPVVDGDAW